MLRHASIFLRIFLSLNFGVIYKSRTLFREVGMFNSVQFITMGRGRGGEIDVTSHFNLYMKIQKSFKFFIPKFRLITAIPN